MQGRIERGDIWLLERPRPDKRRPVVVLSRPSLIQVLSTVTVCAITSKLHGAPTEVALGVSEGLKGVNCANLTNVFTVRQSELRHWVGAVGRDKLHALCEALAIALACDVQP